MDDRFEAMVANNKEEGREERDERTAWRDPVHRHTVINVLVIVSQQRGPGSNGKGREGKGESDEGAGE